MLVAPPECLTAIDAPTTQKKRGGFIGNRQSTFAAVAFDPGFLGLMIHSEPFRVLARILGTLCY